MALIGFAAPYAAPERKGSMKKNAWYIVCLLLISVMIFPQSGWASCPSIKLIPGDGTSDGFVDYAAASSTTWYGQIFLAGHSYSIEAWDPFDPLSGNITLALYDSTCSTVISTTDTSFYVPYLYDRKSWIQTTLSVAYIGVLNSDTTNGHSYHIRITDTTLLNPRWSTTPGWRTQYAFVNVGSTSITGTLTVTDHSGTVVASPSITVPAGGEYLYVLTSPSGDYGFSTFAFVGPPGGVTADAYLINTNIGMIAPSTFNPISTPH